MRAAVARALGRRAVLGKPVPAARARTLRGVHTVLGIETTCDDSGVAVVTSDGAVRAECLSSQISLHASYGGVVPNLAAREHGENLPRVLDTCLGACDPSEIDAIALAAGPGLPPCLAVGRDAAVSLSRRLEVPIFAVNHLEAHILVASLAHTRLAFPFVTLLASGGHCMLVLSLGVGDHRVLGATLDDSAGEAFDKVARLLLRHVYPTPRQGVPATVADGAAALSGTPPALEALGACADAATAVHGGARVEALASQCGNGPIPHLPTPLRGRPDCGFSFSGLKAATHRLVRDQVDLGDPEAVCAVARAFQTSVAQHLSERVSRALHWAQALLPAGSDPPPLVFCGGVAANAYLRGTVQAAAAEQGSECFVPPPQWCTDNGTMIAWAGARMAGAGAQPVGADEVDFQQRMPFGRPLEPDELLQCQQHR